MLVLLSIILLTAWLPVSVKGERNFRAKWFALLLAASFSAVHAEELPLWELGIGAAGITFADYRGSSKQRSYV